MISEISAYRDRLLQSITSDIRDCFQRTGRDHPLSWYCSPHSVPLSSVCHYTRPTALVRYAAWLSSVYVLEFTLCSYFATSWNETRVQGSTHKGTLSRQMCTAQPRPVYMSNHLYACNQTPVAVCAADGRTDGSFIMCLQCKCPQNPSSESVQEIVLHSVHTSADWTRSEETLARLSLW